MNKNIVRPNWLAKVNAVISTKGWHDPISYELLASSRFTVVQVAQYRSEHEDGAPATPVIIPNPMHVHDTSNKPAKGKGGTSTAAPVPAATAAPDPVTVPRGTSSASINIAPPTIDTNPAPVAPNLSNMSTKQLKAFLIVEGIDLKLDGRMKPKDAEKLVMKAWRQNNPA